MSTDARVRYTKMMIVENFIQLLLKKPIQRVTVKEICEMAEINRATFYKHYIDVYDLLEQIENQLLSELNDIFSKREHSTAKDVLTIIMVSLKAEEDTYKAVCSQNGDPTFPAKVFDICYQLTSKSSMFQIKGLSSVQMKWLYHFNAYGCNGILSNWIDGGMKEPISEVADFAEELMNNAIDGLLQNSKRNKLRNIVID